MTHFRPSTFASLRRTWKDVLGLLFAVSAACLLALTSPRAHTVANQVAAYGFTEGSGATATDVSGNGNTAALLNGVMWTNGKYGTGLRFDGLDDHLTIARRGTFSIREHSKPGSS